MAPKSDDLRDQDLLGEWFTVAGKPRSLRAGELLYAEGSSPDQVFLVSAGRLVLTKAGDGDSGRQVAEKEAGDLVGESAALDGGPRTVSARAVESATLLEMESSAFRRRLAEDGLLCFQVALRLAAVIRGLV